MNYLEVAKLRFNSGGSVSHCKGISSLINAPQKRRIFDAPQKRRIFDAPKKWRIFDLRSNVLELDGWL